MNLQRAARVIVDEAQFPESVHEKADPRPGCTDHIRQGFLAHLGDYSLGHAFLAEMSKQEQEPSQSFFAGIEELVN
jgi:hypothetical protein